MGKTGFKVFQRIFIKTRKKKIKKLTRPLIIKNIHYIVKKMKY